MTAAFTNMPLKKKIKRVKGKKKIVKRATASLKTYLRRVLATMVQDMAAAGSKVTKKAIQAAVEKEKGERSRVGRLEKWHTVDYKVSRGMPVEDDDFPGDEDYQSIDDFEI